MVVCILCSIDIHEDCQSYNFSDMGPEMISRIEFDNEVDQNGTVCERCFINILQTMSEAISGSCTVKEESDLHDPLIDNVLSGSSAINESYDAQDPLHDNDPSGLSDVKEEFELQDPLNDNIPGGSSAVNEENYLQDPLNDNVPSDSFAVNKEYEVQDPLKQNNGLSTVKVENELQNPLSQNAPSSSSPVEEERELQQPHNQNACIYCQRSLYSRRTHSLPDRERNYIAKIISPREVPDGSLVCHACWMRVREKLLKEKVEVPPESTATQTTNKNICVWCSRSLARVRSQALPNGPERDEIIAKISPREIPAQGRVCYACWVAARRSVQRAQNIDESRDNSVPAHFHLNDNCALCGMSLFRRQTHAVPSGRERDKLAANISPRELSGNLLCTSCWTVNVKSIAIIDHENMEQQQQQQTIELDFAHTTNSSSHCFVPSCTNTERLTVPNYLRKSILTSHKIFITDHARVCNEHNSLVFDWECLEQQKFSKIFTKNEIQSMLDLCIQELSNN